MAENSGHFDTVSLMTKLTFSEVFRAGFYQKCLNFSVFRGVSNGVEKCLFTGATLKIQVAGAHDFDKKISKLTTFLTPNFTTFHDFHEFSCFCPF